jgi:hypothetical protein
MQKMEGPYFLKVKGVSGLNSLLVIRTDPLGSIIFISPVSIAASIREVPYSYLTRSLILPLTDIMELSSPPFILSSDSFFC